MKSIFGISCIYFLPSWFWATLYIAILLLAGEIVSILGEGLISWLFLFPAFWNKGKINQNNNNDFEKITPCGESYLTHERLVNALNRKGGIDDFSELHFALSRLLAGAAWLCLLVLANSVCYEFMIVVVIIALFILVRLIRNCCAARNWSSSIMPLLSLALILVLSFKCLNLIWLILAITLLFASCMNRSVANVINYTHGSDKVNGDGKKSETVAPNSKNSC
jgi:hypothetical protein